MEVFEPLLVWALDTVNLLGLICVSNTDVTDFCFGMSPS